MRIIHFIETLGRGGAEAVLVAGLPKLRDRGHEVELLFMHPPLDLRDALVAEQITVRELRWAGPIKLLHQLHQRRPDVLHVHLFAAGMLGRWAGHLVDVPVVMSLHHRGYAETGAGVGGWRRRVDQLTARFVKTTFVAVSGVVAEDYRRELGVDVQVVTNAIAPEWFAALPTRAQARARLGLDTKVRLVFAAGRLHWEKGMDILAEAAQLTHGIEFVIAGEGCDRAKLRGVRLLGNIAREDLKLWLCAADVVAVPSRTESFGLFALEALACGMPVVASRIDGLVETLGDAACFFERANPTALAETLQHILDDAPLRQRLRAKGEARARLYTADLWAERMSEIYQQVQGTSAAAANRRV